MNIARRVAGDFPALDLEVSAGRLRRHRVAFPWSLGRAYASESAPGTLRVIPQLAGAGMLSGDTIRQTLRLGPGERLRLESAGAMQVLAGTQGPAQSEWAFDLAEGATLIIDAEPYAMMPGANLSLRTLIRLGPKAIVLAAEMLCHSHETRQGFGAWHSETLVTSNSGADVLIDRQTCSPQTQMRLMGLPQKVAAFGTIWILATPDKSAHATEALPELSCRVALTTLRGDAGYALRFAARDGGQLRSNLRRAMRTLEARLFEAQAAACSTEATMVAQT